VVLVRLPRAVGVLVPPCKMREASVWETLFCVPYLGYRGAFDTSPVLVFAEVLGLVCPRGCLRAPEPHCGMSTRDEGSDALRCVAKEAVVADRNGWCTRVGGWESTGFCAAASINASFCACLLAGVAALRAARPASVVGYGARFGGPSRARFS
jgi:hypothetical protein